MVNLENMLILNVDDDMDDREMFQAAVTAVDPTIECKQFESGTKVIEYITHSEIAPDFLYIDINMPKMNGYECLERVKQLPGSDKIQIVMYSTAFNPRQQDDLKSTGIRYLKKTSKFSELVQAIGVILSDAKELAKKSKK